MRNIVAEVRLSKLVVLLKPCKTEEEEPMEPIVIRLQNKRMSESKQERELYKFTTIQL